MKISDIEGRLAEEGYCIFEDLLDRGEAERLDKLARSIMNAMGPGYISLEGALNEMPDLAPLCTHPLILELAESVLGEGFFVANNVALKWCKPGTPEGALHADWPTRGVAASEPGSVMPPWNGLQVFWMLTDSTPENGATRIVPFSHHTRRGPSRDSYADEIPVKGRKGSAFVYHNGLWHRSGGNTTTDQHRMLANIYLMPMSVHRPRGTWPLLKRDIYETSSPRLRELTARSADI